MGGLIATQDQCKVFLRRVRRLSSSVLPEGLNIFTIQHLETFEGESTYTGARIDTREDLPCKVVLLQTYHYTPLESGAHQSSYSMPPLFNSVDVAIRTCNDVKSEVERGGCCLPSRSLSLYPYEFHFL